MITTHAVLKAKRTDLYDYTTYVFKSLEEDAPFGRRYIMCTRFPNWQEPEIDIDEVGYLSFKEVIAGVDEWFDGQSFHPYNYSNLIFVKFVREPKKEDEELLL